MFPQMNYIILIFLIYNRMSHTHTPHLKKFNSAHRKILITTLHDDLEKLGQYQQ